MIVENTRYMIITNTRDIVFVLLKPPRIHFSQLNTAPMTRVRNSP